MELRTDSCVVRNFQLDDAASLAHNGNNRKVWLNLRDLFPHPYSEADAVGYIAMVMAQPQQTNFAITVDGVAIGGIGLRVGHDIERCSAELGYWLGEPYWGRGIATAAIEAVTRYAFSQLDLVRLFAVPFAGNVASCRVLEKAGYEREGLLRRSAIKDGEFQDQYMYAAVAEG
jgi:RimJ/RimL family protein N-acetyltransferase